MAQETADILLTRTADIVAAHIANNRVALGDLGGLIVRVHEALAGLGRPVAPPEVAPVPAVPIRASVKPDHIVCLEDGTKLKMLKRHLATHHGMTPADYRAKWKLGSDYPLVAPNYAMKRQELAKASGLGRKPEAAPTAPVGAEAEAATPTE